MRFPSKFLVGAAALLLGACGKDATAPSTDIVTSILAADYASSLAAAMDGAGVGAVNLPEDLQLSAEQQAAIAALHAAFEAANAADIATLKGIEAEARTAAKAGKPRDQVQFILSHGAAAAQRLTVAFVKLQSDIWQLYTQEQRAWIEAHRPPPCGPGGPPPLREAQIQAIRALQEAFTHTVQNDIAEIRRVAELAHQAQAGGATRGEVEAILHQADAAQGRVRQAERALQAAIDALLTPEQRAHRCGGGGVLPGRP